MEKLNHRGNSVEIYDEYDVDFVAMAMDIPLTAAYEMLTANHILSWMPNTWGIVNLRGMVK